MQLCTDTITIFNRKTNPTTGMDTYWPTVIHGCSWYDKHLATVTDSGLKNADEVIIRIPTDADFAGKDYVHPAFWEGADPTQSYTLNSKTWVAYGECVPNDLTREGIRSCTDRLVTVIGVNDNRRAKGRHWKLIAK